jgi:hypothetical protein
MIPVDTKKKRCYEPIKTGEKSGTGRRKALRWRIMILLGRSSLWFNTPQLAPAHLHSPYGTVAKIGRLFATINASLSRAYPQIEKRR